MEVFKLIVDEKIEGWRRSYIDVEADSLEEAVEMVKEDSIGAAVDDGIYDSEFLYETEELVKRSPEHPCTIEIMDRNWNLLYCDRDESLG